jgi:hypothetical protein
LNVAKAHSQSGWHNPARPPGSKPSRDFVSCRLEHSISERNGQTTEHDHLRIENGDQHCKAGTQPSTTFGNDAECVDVVGERRIHNVARRSSARPPRRVESSRKLSDASA